MDGKVLVVGYYRWEEESSSCCVQIHSSFSVATIPQVIRYRVCSVWEGCVQDCWKCMFTTIIPPFLMRIFSLFIYGLQIQGLKCKSTRSARVLILLLMQRGEWRMNLNWRATTTTTAAIQRHKYKQIPTQSNNKAFAFSQQDHMGVAGVYTIY